MTHHAGLTATRLPDAARAPCRLAEAIAVKLLVLLALCMPLTAASAVTAAPVPTVKPLKSLFVPTTDRPAQHFAVAQAPDGKIYVGGTSGLLSFNGTRWHQVNTTSTIRRLVHDGTRLWIGGYNAFGYLAVDVTGTESFVNLTPRFADRLKGRDFADVWHVRVRPEGTYFVALRDLFFVSAKGETVRHWHHEGRFGAPADWQGALVVQWRGEGLKRLEGGEFRMLPGGEALARDLVFGFVAMPDDRLLTYGVSRELGLFGPNGLEPLRRWPGPALHTALYNEGLRLDERRIAFACTDGRLRILDLEQQRETAYEIGSSFVTSITADSRGGAIWATDAEGLHRLNWPPRWTYYGAEAGVRGSLTRLRIGGRRVFLATDGGILESQLDAAGELATFTYRDWCDGECWDVHIDGSKVVIADSYSLKEIEGGKVRPLSPRDLYAREFMVSRLNPAQLWIATEHGVARAERGPTGWRLAARYALPSTRITSMIEMPGGRELLVGTSDGAMRLRFSDAQYGGHRYETLLEPANPAARGEYDVLLSKAGAEIVASAPDGLFVLRGDRFVTGDPFGLATLRRPGEAFAITEMTDGALWAQSERGIYRRNTGSSRWAPQEVNPFRRGLFGALTVAEDGTAFTGTTGTLFRYRAVDAPPPTRTPHLSLVGVEMIDAEGRLKRQALSGNPGLPRDMEQVTFELGFDDYTRIDPARFEFRLAGLESRFGPPTEQPRVTYALLPAGQYQLEARVHDSAGRLHILPPYAFSVLPYWHERTDMRAALVMLASLGLFALVFGAARWRTRALLLRTRQLDELVRMRTRELEAANAKLSDLASRDGLTGVANRRQFDQTLLSLAQRGAKEGADLALLMVDVDHFKRYNDTYGHLAGDDLLKRVGHILQEEADACGGVAARYGGEEFAVLMPRVSLDRARIVAEQIRARVAALDANITISLGLAQGVVHPEATERLIAAADAALYLAKNRGRNRLEVALHASRETEHR